MSTLFADRQGGTMRGAAEVRSERRDAARSYAAGSIYNGEYGN